MEKMPLGRGVVTETEEGQGETMRLAPQDEASSSRSESCELLRSRAAGLWTGGRNKLVFLRD